MAACNKAEINIGGDPSDPCYRYKMPVPICTHEGKGQNTRTIITNAGGVSRALQRNPEWITKYLSLVANSPAKYSDSRISIKGMYTQSDILKYIKKFIDVCVLCKTCTLPEIKIKFSKKKGVLYTKCDACGECQKLRSSNAVNDKMFKFIKHQLS